MRGDVIDRSGVVDNGRHAAGRGHVIAHQSAKRFRYMDVHVDHTGQNRLAGNIVDSFAAQIFTKLNDFAIPDCNILHFSHMIDRVDNKSALEYRIVFHLFSCVQSNFVYFFHSRRYAHLSHFIAHLLIKFYLF